MKPIWRCYICKKGIKMHLNKTAASLCSLIHVLVLTNILFNFYSVKMRIFWCLQRYCITAGLSGRWSVSGVLVLVHHSKWKSQIIWVQIQITTKKNFLQWYQVIQIPVLKSVAITASEIKKNLNSQMNSVQRLNIKA